VRAFPVPPKPEAAAIVDWIDDVVTITARNNAEAAAKHSPGQVYQPKVAAKASLPSAPDFTGGIIAVSDDVGGFTLAFSDGTNWRRVQDRNVIS
jgi:hypothetical protein